jgi:two-component system, OmpR family, phosphate regulon sensor histidine kinase PhoR
MGIEDTNRAHLQLSAICFGGALLMALLAGLEFALPQVDLAPGWILFAAAALLTAVGMTLQARHRAHTDSLARTQSKLSLVQAQLEQQRAAVDRLADGLDVAIFVCNPRAEILYANRRAMELFRFTKPIGRSVLAVTLSYDLEQLVLASLREGEAQSAELQFTYPEERVGLSKAWPDLESERAFLSIYEITDLRRLERVRQDFVGNVSHEMRTPLTVIRAMAETLLDDPDVDEATQDRYLKGVISEVDRLSQISGDLLVLSTAESTPVRKHACNLSEIFRATAEQLRPRAERKGLELRFAGPPDLTIAANSSQMSQVAINLIENAINYTQEGSIEIEVRQQEDEAHVEIRDTGVGIPSEHLARIFERFYRVDKARSRATGGTGLGLSIVNHIVEAHGGQVSVESSLNRGSTFGVALPIGDEAIPLRPEEDSGDDTAR